MGPFGRSKIAQASPVAPLIAPRASQVRPKSDQRAPQDRPRAPLDDQEGLQNAQQGQKYLPKGSPRESERGPRGSPRPFLTASKHFELELTENAKTIKNAVRYRKIQGSETPNCKQNRLRRASWRQKWSQDTKLLLTCAQLSPKIVPRSSKTHQIRSRSDQ